MRWLLTGLAIPVAAGFVIYDLRAWLLGSDPFPASASATAPKACDSLPKPGIEGRYQDNPACPSTIRVGPKRDFSGTIDADEHGATFLPDDNEPEKDTNAWFEWRIGPKWGISIDDKALRSLQLPGADPFTPGSPPHRVRLRGWRTTQAVDLGLSGESFMLFVDEFLSVEPESP